MNFKQETSVRKENIKLFLNKVVKRELINIEIELRK